LEPQASIRMPKVKVKFTVECAATSCAANSTVNFTFIRMPKVKVKFTVEFAAQLVAALQKAIDHAKALPPMADAE